MYIKNQGTCSLQTIVDLDGDTIRSVRFVGGCDGNTKGICALVKGMKAGEVIARCKGMTCGRKSTSCPDQLAQALEEAQAQQKYFQAAHIHAGIEHEGAADISAAPSLLRFRQHYL